MKKPDSMKIEYRESHTTMTPAEVDRIQDKIVQYFVQDYYAEQRNTAPHRVKSLNKK